MSKKQFYKELKDVVKESYIKNKGLREGYDVRLKIESDVDNFILNQNYLKRITKNVYSNVILSYIIGEIIYELNYSIDLKVERETFILKMAQYVYDMFSIGENPMCCADVYILINNHNNWLRFLK